MADTLRYVVRKAKGGLLSEGRLYVAIEGLEAGMQLTETQALIVLLDQLDSMLLDIKEDVHAIWKET